MRPGHWQSSHPEFELFLVASETPGTSAYRLLAGASFSPKVQWSSGLKSRPGTRHGFGSGYICRGILKHQKVSEQNFEINSELHP